MLGANNKAFWIVFGTVQLFGQVCFWIWPLFKPSIGVFLWGVSLFTQFPGNAISTELVESLFWQKMSLIVMSVVAFPIGLLINAILWAVAAICFLKLLRVFRAKSVVENGD